MFNIRLPEQEIDELGQPASHGWDEMEDEAPDELTKLDKHACPSWMACAGQAAKVGLAGLDRLPGISIL